MDSAREVLPGDTGLGNLESALCDSPEADKTKKLHWKEEDIEDNGKDGRDPTKDHSEGMDEVVGDAYGDADFPEESGTDSVLVGEELVPYEGILVDDLEERCLQQQQTRLWKHPQQQREYQGHFLLGDDAGDVLRCVEPQQNFQWS